MKKSMAIITSLFMLGLTACGGESTGEEHTGTEPSIPPQSAPPAATYGGANIAVNSGYQVIALKNDALAAQANSRLLHIASVSNQTELTQTVSLADVVTLNNAHIIDLSSTQELGTGKYDCRSATATTGLEFSVNINSPASCQYEYTVSGTNVEGDQVTQSATFSVFATSDITTQSIEETPLQITYPYNDSDDTINTINLAAQLGYPSGYILTDVEVLGEGHAEIDSNEPRTNEIKYTVYQNQIGYTRLVYTLEDTNQDLKTGAIDITVSVNNEGLIANDFCFPHAQDVNNSYCEPELGNSDALVRLGESTEINIVNFISDNEGDNLQLVHVESMTGDVQIVDTESVFNTEFTFTAQNQGKHHVTYIAADHYGHFSTGVITVNVGAPMFTQIESYPDASLALSVKGNVWFIGRAQRNNTGLPSCSLEAEETCQAYVYNRWVKIPTLRNIDQISVSVTGNSFALDRDNQLWIIGLNTYGELGTGNITPVTKWQKFDDVSSQSFAARINAQLSESGYVFQHIQRVVAGAQSVFALVTVVKSNDASINKTLLFATGANQRGQLGVDLTDPDKWSNVNQWTLAQFDLLDGNFETIDGVKIYPRSRLTVGEYNIFDVSGSDTHALAVVVRDGDVDADGDAIVKVYATGSNTYGQLGDVKIVHPDTHVTGDDASFEDGDGAVAAFSSITSSEWDRPEEVNVYATGGSNDYGTSYVKGAGRIVYSAGINHTCQLLLGPQGSEKNNSGNDITDKMSEKYGNVGADKEVLYPYLSKLTTAHKPFVNDAGVVTPLGTLLDFNAKGYFAYMYKTATADVPAGVYVAGNNSARQLGVSDDGDGGATTNNCYLKRVPDSEDFDILAPGIMHGIIASSTKQALMATGRADYHATNDNKPDFRDINLFSTALPSVSTVAVCANTAALRSDSACIQVLKANSGEFYTAPISHGALLALGYDTANIIDNQGKTFANYVLANPTADSYGYYHNSELNPGAVNNTDGEGYYDFEAFFRQDGMLNNRRATIQNSGEGGQFDRLCKTLATQNFYGKNDWRRAAYEDLKEIDTSATDSPFLAASTLWTDDLGVVTLGATSSANSNVFANLSAEHQTVCVTGPKPESPAFVKVAIGRDFSYGLLANGKLMSVGSNSNGQLAIGDKDSNPQKNNWVNANLTGPNGGQLSEVVDIAVGVNFAYALTSDGNLWSVGDNSYGQLGLGHTDSRNRWEQLPAPYPTNIKQIIGANHNAYILTDDGEVWGVGDNREKQLGEQSETCGTEYCSKTWKLSNVWDADGDGTLDVNPPTITSISAGIKFAYALDTEGSIWSIGNGANSVLGIGDTSVDINYWQRSYNANNAAKEPIVKVSAGGNSGYAIDASGNVYVVGRNSEGQLGTEESGGYGNWTPMVNLPARFATIVPGHRHAYALDYSGNVYSVGNNDHGQLGVDSTTNSSQWQRTSLTDTGLELNNIIDVIAAPHFSSNFGFARKANTGWLWGVGDNEWGQQGRGTATEPGNSINRWMQYRVSTP